MSTVTPAPQPDRPASTPGVTGPVFCVYDDRRSHLDALMLSVLSILRHVPGARVIASTPALEPAERAWFARLPGVVEVREQEQFGGSGWDVKPELLLARLQEHEDVVWWDSDVLAAGDPTVALEPRVRGELVATEDTSWAEQQGTDVRTRAWGLPVGRVLAGGVNSGVLRVQRTHLPLLRHWKRLLDTPGYRLAQSMPGHERPLHMLGDQEALAALLGSTEHDHVPVRLVRRGRGIAQCWGPAGFSVSERLTALLTGGPVLVHAIVTKPWIIAADGTLAPFPLSRSPWAWRAWWDSMHAETSPYTLVARGLRDDLDGKPAWLHARSRLGLALERLPGNPVVTAGLPLAVVDTAFRLLKARRRPEPKRPADVSVAG